MTEPLILGGSVAPFGRHRDGSHWRDWVRQAGNEALEDAGLEVADIDAVVVASESDFLSLQINPGPVVLDEMGLSGRPVVRVEGGLYCLLDIEVVITEHAGHEIALFNADPMFSVSVLLRSL